MQHTHFPWPQVEEHEGFKRNNFFYGKVMDVHQFRMETNYFNEKRWAMNRLSLGHGVLCGIDVVPDGDRKAIILTHGVAIDKWGREIFIPKRTNPIPVPAEHIEAAHEMCGKDEHPCVHALLCYHECLTDPAPVMAGDCCHPEPCAPGAIRERYCVEFRPGRAPEVDMRCRLPGVIEGECLNYKALVRWVTDRGCTKPAHDPCIVIANIHFPRHKPPHHHGPLHIDIDVRQIIFTNRLLGELIPCILGCEAEDEADE